MGIRPPSAFDAITHRGLIEDDARSWNRTEGHSPRPMPSEGEASHQALALASLISHRIATTLDVQAIDDSLVQQKLQTAFGQSFNSHMPPQWLGELYRSSLQLAPSQSEDRFSSLSATLFAQQMRLLALGSYALVAFAEKHHSAAQDVKAYEVFDRLAALKIPPKEKKTTVTTSSANWVTSTTATVDLALLAHCNPTSLAVIRRRVSINDRRFEEVVDATCSDNTKIIFTHLGILSTDLARLLEVNSDYLDITNVSMTVRDLTAFTSSWLETPNDIDLVRINSRLALSLDLVALSAPSTPWSYIRDALLPEWPGSTEWFTSGWLHHINAEFPYPTPREVLTTPAALATEKEGAFLSEVRFLQAQALKRFVDGVEPTVKAMPDTVDNCGDFISKLLSFGGDCGYSGFTSRRRFLKQLNELKSEEAFFRVGQESIDQPKCFAMTNNRTDWIDTKLDTNLQDFVTRYSANGCYAATQGRWDLPVLVETWLRDALRHDPRFINRYALDFNGSTNDWTERLQEALIYSRQAPVSAFLSTSYLRSTELIFYLPSIAAPRDAWEGFPRNNRIVAYTDIAPLNAMVAPLLRSRAGLDLAADLALIQHEYIVTPKAPTPKIPLISIAFMEKLRGLEDSSLAKVYAQVDEQVATAQASISPQEQTPFTFGVSVGMGNGVVPGFFFTYAGVGISATFASPVIVTPLLPPFRMPGLPLIFNSTDSGTPSRSEGTLPLPQDPMQLAGARAADVQIMTTDVRSSLPELRWPGLLLATNYVGRMWLKDQFTLAAPLLTKIETKQIAAAFDLPSFPVGLAKLIATKADEAIAAPSAVKLRGSGSDEAAEKACNTNMWSNCGLAIKLDLDKRPEDPEAVVYLAALWGKAFDNQYEILRRTGHLERATPEAQRVEAILNGHLNPTEIAKDNAKDRIKDGLRASMSRLGFVIKNGNPTARASLKAYFENLPETASDYDELLLMNDVLQQEIGRQLAPFLKADWHGELLKSINQTTPQWGMPN
jgi:hypothetical protein